MSRSWFLGAVLLLGSGPFLFFSCASSSSLNAGKLYLKQQKYDLAIEQLELAIHEDSTSAEGFYHLGRAYGLTGYHVDMVAAFDRSLQLSDRYAGPIHEERLRYWARMYNDGVRIANLTDPDLDRALHKFELATRILPGRLQAWRNLGFTQYGTGETDDAVATFEHVTRVSPSDTASRRVLGTLYLDRGDLDDAVKALATVVAQGENFEALTNLGVAYQRLGEFEAAEQAYLELLDHYPDLWQTHYNLGSLYWSTGRLSDAQHAFERAVGLNPADVSARYNLAAVHLSAEHFAEAVPLLEQLSVELARNEKIWHELGRAYEATGEFDKSRRAYERAEALAAQ